MKIFKILKKTTVEGPGVRFCIWTQGCSRHCKGCYAKDSWNFSKGKEYSVDEIFNQIISQKSIEGVTFLGGEPFEQAKELSVLAKRIKENNLSIVCFTGFTIEELKAKNNPETNELLKYIDLLIDGKFEEDKFDLSRPWVGSKNQRYIFLTDKYKESDIRKYKNKIEARINKNGKLEINGMGDFGKIEKDFCLQLGKNIVE